MTVKQKMIFWFLLSAVVMLLLPWLAVTFIKGDGGMAVCFILFFAVNPIYSVTAGVFAGKNGKRHLYCMRRFILFWGFLACWFQGLSDRHNQTVTIFCILSFWCSDMYLLNVIVIILRSMISCCMK